MSLLYVLGIDRVFSKIFWIMYIPRNNRVRNSDFISKQKTLELSQSGIGFVMGWNLAKS